MFLQKKGFTLIELLVVFAIIGVLASIIVVSTANLRSKARDGKRVFDTQQITTALEAYYARNSFYPTFITTGAPLTAGGTTYMSEIPTNPVPRADGDCSDADFRYEVEPGNNTYHLTFCLGQDSGRLKKGLNVCTNGTCLSGGDLKVKDSSGNDYATVSIGGQLWMAENIRAGTQVNGNLDQGDADDGNIQKYCYGDNPANCDIFGALYQWHTAMALPQSCDTSNAGCVINPMHQGICPTGWHVPTDAEWHQLEMAYADPANDSNCDANHDNGNCSPAAQALKSAALWNGQEGSNESGFGGLPSGYRDPSDGQFYCSGDDECDSGHFWTASVYNNAAAYQRNFYLEEQEVHRGNYGKGYGFGLRCLKDY